MLGEVGSYGTEVEARNTYHVQRKDDNMLATETDIDKSSDALAPDPSKHTSDAPNLPHSIHRLRCNDPWRPPDWRWHRAQLLLMQPETDFRDRNDELVDLAMRFLQRDHGSPKSPGFERPLPESTETAIRDARQLHERYDIATWSLQAWLLTGESLEVISQKILVPVETVTWYGRLFFDVVDRLDHRSFITHRVIGPKIHYGLNVKDVDVIWRFWAYGGGPCILESLLDDFAEAGWSDYGYLLDGTYRNADLPHERQLAQQALRVQLLSPEDIMKMLNTALNDPEIAARAPSFHELIELFVTSDMGYPSAPAGEAGVAGAA
jgi:hypothetical protein